MKTLQRYANLSKVYLNENDFFYISNEITEELQELYDLIITTAKMLNLEIKFNFYEENNLHFVTFVGIGDNHVYINILLYNNSTILKKLSIETFSPEFLTKLTTCTKKLDTITVSGHYDNVHSANSDEGIIDLLKSFLKCI